MSATTGTTGAMLRTQFAVEQRVFWRNASSVFFTFVLPIGLLLALSLDSSPSRGVPFIAALGVVSTGFQGLTIQLAMHREQGLLKQLMASPLPAWVLIAGKALAMLVVVLIEMTVVVVVSHVLLGVAWPEHPLVLLVLVLAGVTAFVPLAFALASIIPSSDSAPAITNAAYLGLILVTAVVHNLHGIPRGVRQLAELLPLSALFVPIAHAWNGGWHASEWQYVAVLVGWGLLGLAISARWFRWAPSHER